MHRLSGNGEAAATALAQGEAADRSEDLPGQRLRRAREAIGASLRDVSLQTRIAERHLASIEFDDYRAFSAVIYAVGFARSYARFVGLPEAPLADAVRAEYAALPDRRGWC